MRKALLALFLLGSGAAAAPPALQEGDLWTKVPLDEPVISPASMAASPRLVTVAEKR